MTPQDAAYAEEKGICGASCYYGGLSAARKYSKSDLGWMWHCNRRTKDGQRCHQHRNVQVKHT